MDATNVARHREFCHSWEQADISSKPHSQVGPSSGGRKGGENDAAVVVTTAWQEDGH